MFVGGGKYPDLTKWGLEEEASESDDDAPGPADRPPQQPPPVAPPPPSDPLQGLEEEAPESDEEGTEERPEHPPPLRSPYFSIRETPDFYIKKFGVSGVQYKIDWDLPAAPAPAPGFEAGGLLSEALDRVIEKAFVSADHPTDKVGLEITHPELDGGNLIIPFTDRERLTTGAVIALLNKVQQSKRNLNFDGTLGVHATRIHNPRGSGGIVWSKDFLKSRAGGHGSGLILIRAADENDRTCAARALVVALAYAEAERDPDDERPRRRAQYLSKVYGQQAQANEAARLMAKAGLTDFRDPAGLEEIKRMERVLTRENGYQVKIFSKDCMNMLMYRGNGEADKSLYLHLADGHYNAVSNPSTFYANSGYCRECDRAYNVSRGHTCRATCPFCRKNPKCSFLKKKKDWTKCRRCNRWFPSQECLANHSRDTAVTTSGGRKRKKTLSTCERVRKCPVCHYAIGQYHGKKHVCFTYFCSVCKRDARKGDHQCFFEPKEESEKKKKKEPKSNHIFFDFDGRAR